MSQCFVQVGSELLSEVFKCEQFECLGVLFLNDSTMQHETDRQIGTATAAMWAFYQILMVKRQLSWQTNLSVYHLMHIPVLTMIMKLGSVGKNEITNASS